MLATFGSMMNSAEKATASVTNETIQGTTRGQTRASNRERKQGTHSPQPDPKKFYMQDMNPK